MIESLVKSLFYTLVIELIVAIIIGIRDKNDIKVVICANVCTNPIVVFIANIVYSLGIAQIYIFTILILEISVLFVEEFIYKKYLKYNNISPFAISFVCNVISFGTGIIISNIR